MGSELEVVFGQAFQSKIWITLLARHLGIQAVLGVARRSQCCLLGGAFVGKPLHEGPWVYEPDRSPRAPG